MRILSLLVLIAIGQALIPCRPAAQDWTHWVRIGGYGLSLDRVDGIVRSATDSHVFGIETDNDIPGRYESFLDPTEKLKAIKAVAEKAHAAGNYAFVYIAGLECITAHADQSPHSLFKDHPDWVQRKITGEPAVFSGGAAFWIAPGDEDVWISPFAPEWRKVYMERVRQIAATGIDGVYVDIPYWMTHFDKWEETWASFDDYTVAAFKKKSGLDARHDIRIGDYQDPGFLQWINFRIDAITDFMRDIDRNVKSVNPNCKTIAEIYPGIEESAPRVGADVYELYPVVDVIAHEYEYGGGDHMAASRTPLDWFGYMAGMYSFRSFARDKATWMLNYSWDGEKGVKPGEAMKNLFLSEIMAGANVWDARGHVMSGSNDLETRKEVFQWIAGHEKTFFSPRQPIQPIGVYFSPSTRNYFPEDFIRSYRGMMFLLMQAHREFQVVTPRSITKFSGPLLILPDVKCLGSAEIAALRAFVQSGRTLMLTGETAMFDDRRKEQPENPLHKLLGIDDSHRSQESLPKYVYEPKCPGKKYYGALEKGFNQYATAGDYREAAFNGILQDFIKQLSAVSILKSAIEIDASPFVSTQIASVGGKPHVFIANFKGLKSREIAEQTPERNVRIAFAAKNDGKVYALPFLGQAQQLTCRKESGRLACAIPEIEKGMVVWLDGAR
jgi:Glycosyl hydrolase-like 10